MRLLGGIMIVGGCLGLGMWYREQVTGRLHALRTLADMLDMLMSEIRYGKSALPECCRLLAERVEEPYGECLREICRKTDEGGGISFPKIFAQDMEACLEKLPLTKEDRQIFLRIFTRQAFQDGKMQLRAVEQGKEQLVRIIGEQEREQKEKCRMAVGLGAMGGLLVVIVLM